MTEDTHILLSEVSGVFARAVARAAADVLAALEPSERDEALYYLQDQTSLFSPLTSDHITKVLVHRDETWGPAEREHAAEGLRYLARKARSQS